MQITRARAGRAADDRWHIRKDGTRFRAHGTMEPLHAADSALRGFVEVLRDNTERKNAEEELREKASRRQRNQ